MTTIEAKLLHYKDESFGEGENRFENHVLLLQNPDATNSRYSEFKISVPFEEVQKYKLNDTKVLDTLRSKTIYIRGNMYMQSVGYINKSGDPSSREVLRFKALNIAFDATK
jgi:hypothetical protein